VRRARHLQSGAQPWGHVGCDAVGVKQTGSVESGLSGLQQSWPDVQHEEPQQVPVRQSIKLLHGSFMQVPAPQ
jgi:hypothetical protein